MSTNAVLLSIVATLLWGGWALLADAAAEDLSSVAIMLAVGLVQVVVALVGLTAGGGFPEISGAAFGLRRVVLLAVLAGVASVGATVLYYAALGIADGAIVPTTITGLYFAVTAVAEWAFLGGDLGAQEIAGVGLAAAAVVLLVTA